MLFSGIFLLFTKAERKPSSREKESDIAYHLSLQLEMEFGGESMHSKSEC